MDLERVDFDSRTGQNLRRELLVALKDQAGLKYREIAKPPEFAAVRVNALGSMYRYAKAAQR